jgi:hypothetical protein
MMLLAKITRVVRGFVMTAAVWAIVWAIVGILLRIAGVLGERRGWFLLAPVELWAINGAIAGGVFAALLVASRRRTIEMLSTARVTGWGAAASLVLPAGVAIGALMRNPQFFSEASPLPQLLTFAIVGAITAAGSLWIARRASDRSSGDNESGPMLLASAAPELEPAERKGNSYSETDAPRPKRLLNYRLA